MTRAWRPLPPPIPLQSGLWLWRPGLLYFHHLCITAGQACPTLGCPSGHQADSISSSSRASPSDQSQIHQASRDLVLFFGPSPLPVELIGKAGADSSHCLSPPPYKSRAGLDRHPRPTHCFPTIYRCITEAQRKWQPSVKKPSQDLNHHFLPNPNSCCQQMGWGGGWG